MFLQFSRNLRVCSCRHSSNFSDSSTYYSKFFAENVQNELFNLTEFDPNKVFRVYRTGKDIKAPIYKFMTDAEYKSELKVAMEKGRRKLQMPPVLLPRSPVSKVISSDAGLIGLNGSKFVFTDITYGVHDRERLIVVREPNGELRTAEWEERDRMNTIYFPKRGRRIITPPLFSPEHLKKILGEDKYEYILAKNVEQFEPDHPIYIQTASAVFEHIDYNKSYNVLLSTRFYGPMVFTYILNRSTDNLVLHYIQRQNLKALTSLFKLFGMIYNSEDNIYINETESDVSISLKQYLQFFSQHPSKVKAAFDSLNELLESERITNEDILKAHGK